MYAKNCFEAVFFDMDGVVVDSMPYHFISWFEVLRQYGVRINPFVIFEMEGTKWDEFVKLMFKQSGKLLLPEIMETIHKKREELFKKHFQRYIFENIFEFIKSLKNKGNLVGLVTGSNLREVENLLPKELYKLFDTVITGDMIKKAKPDPYPYLIAAKNLKILPKNCIVIENAPYGIKAAKAAGMFCCAVVTSLNRASLKEADKIFDTHEDLYKYFNVSRETLNDKHEVK
ncbi:MAG: HAD family phosphatase [Endomicrobium sp.]|jgi:beta-phosphoglucomutase|nr:HAD family phosphatase [Endomicrobium sp.]